MPKLDSKVLSDESIGDILLYKEISSWFDAYA